MSQTLPIHPFRGRILAELERAGSLILTAPTGSGKSTQLPQFLLGQVAGKILVLEPRRLSARSLAARVAAETKTALGGKIGYQVRFDNRSASDTAIVFQTYGIFISQVLRNPDLPGVGAVLLDEFHERALECDLSLAWLKQLRKKRPELKLVVMSATLEAEPLTRYLPQSAHVKVPGRLFPVDIRHIPPDLRVGPAENALKALRMLMKEGLDGSVLIFMPGLKEIRRSLTVLGPHCREHGLSLHGLHGSMEPSEQDQVLAPTATNRVIVSTNVAETGLTIPSVTMVIDSGLHRVAAYDAARGINTLYLSKISRSNAAQRAGRAGRTAPGRCIRLWTLQDEAGMAPSIKPEISRLELSSLFLETASLPQAVDWLTPPQDAAWSSAQTSLSDLGAVDEKGRVTPRGRTLLRYPAPPKVAAVLEAARALGPEAYERACAMAAVFETAGERRPDKVADLATLAQDLLVGTRVEVSWESLEMFKQLKRAADSDEIPGSAPAGALERVWLDAFTDRLAAREGAGSFYRLLDGRGALLPVEKNPPPLILALDIRERAGGGQARQINVVLYLPYEPETIQKTFPNECVWRQAAEFDERKQRVVNEERLLFRGLVLARREAPPKKEDGKASADIWADKFAMGEFTHPGYDDKARQLVLRIKLARKLYPDMGFPEMNADDWRLVYGEACSGRNTLKEIERVNLIPHIEGFLGPALAGDLERILPASRRLPSGKTGRFTYFESSPAELAAPLGDFIQMTGTLSLCEGRLSVSFDILAPNHRTVQKTKDLDSFWKNAYPNVKKELQRRYPKHPWL